MKILQVVATLNPAAGGIAEGVIQQDRELRSNGHLVHTVTLDFPGVSLGEHSDLGKVFPLGPSSRRYGFSANLEPWLRSHCRSYDVIVVHGLWQYHGYCVRRVANAL